MQQYGTEAVVRRKLIGIGITALWLGMCALAGSRHEKTADVIFITLGAGFLAAMSIAKLYLVLRPRRDGRTRESAIHITGGVFPLRVRKFLFDDEKKPGTRIDPVM